MTDLGAEGSPVAAWYPDPAGSGGLRYWDGAGWTQHVTPSPSWAPAPHPTPAGPPERTGPRLWPLFALIGVLLAAATLTALVMLAPRAARAGSRFTDLAAQQTAREAVDAARAIDADDGTYLAATPEALGARAPDITFTAGPSEDFTTASVFASSEEFTVAVQSLSGRCFVIIERDGLETVGRMQQGVPCLAPLAFSGIVPDPF